MARNSELLSTSNSAPNYSVPSSPSAIFKCGSYIFRAHCTNVGKYFLELVTLVDTACLDLETTAKLEVLFRTNFPSSRTARGDILYRLVACNKEINRPISALPV
jgi:hypothetical protein